MTRIRSIVAALITLVLPALMPSHASAAWSRCSGEGGTCNMSGAGHHLLRYGDNGKFFYIETDGGVTAVPCNNAAFGDSDRGSDDKACDYATLGPVDPQTQWQWCAGEGATCGINDNLPHLIKYSSDKDSKRAEYRIGTGKVPCFSGNNLFPGYFIDVDVGAHKSCWFATARYGEPNGLAFTDCASENQPCNVPETHEIALVRFGGQGGSVFRLASIAQFNCSNGVFAFDPAKGDTKFCQYAHVPPHITGLSGTWNQVGSCTGCDNLQRNVTVGIQGSRSNAISKTWSHEVSIEVEKGWKNAGWSVKGGYKASWGGSESTETSVSRSVTTTMSATCSAPAGKLATMYQWSMDVTDECYALEGQCKSSIRAFDILCTARDPGTAENIPANFGAACPPGQPTSEDIANCEPLTSK
jgi:hypothetical protein